MTSLESVWQPSVLDLARSGNFRALTYWINSYLLPQGIQARVETTNSGCLQIWVELRQPPERERLVQSICHLIWRLNSEVIDGVRIIARLAGQPEILWKQSVRIVTPANRQRQHQFPPIWDFVQEATDAVNFKVLRSMLVLGTALTSFMIGCWLSYRFIVTNRMALSPMASNPTVNLSQHTRPPQVKTALETINVQYRNSVSHPHDPVVTLMFAGDLSASDFLSNEDNPNSQGTFGPMDLAQKVDLALMNLENSQTYPEVAGTDSQQMLKMLQQGGIDVVNLASYSAIPSSLAQEETFQTFEAAGISSIGVTYEEKRERRPEIFEVKGQRIAYLGYDSADFAQGTSASRLKEQQLAEDIRAIRNQVDWVIVNYHWNETLDEYPAQWQRDLAHLTIDQGADMVVGYHPYVLQGAEIYKGRPIAYSLGNFIFGDNSISDYDTAVLKVSLKGKKMKVEFVPVEVRQYQPQVVKGEAGENILNYLAELSQEFERPMRSPVILDTHRETPSLSNATPSPSMVSPKPAASGSYSLIQMPVFPRDIIERHYLKPDVLDTDQGEETTIQDDPFIKHPFIMPPADPHSALPGVPHASTPSFNLSKSRAEPKQKAIAAGRQERHQALKLPVFG
jgi:hypothetical protein